MGRTSPHRTAVKAPEGVWPRVQRALAGAAVLLSLIGGGAVVGGGALYIWVPDLRSFAAGVVGVGALALLLALLASLVQVRAFLTSLRGRYTMNALLMSLALVAIAVLVNFIAFRNPVRVDATATKQFSLAPQTVKVLKELKEPVRATAFFVPVRAEQRALRRQADDLLFEFQRRSGRKFTYRFVDPEAEPSIARQYRVTRYPAIVFEALESGRRYTLVIPSSASVAEQDLTSGLLIVTGARQKKVYFLTGHGERDITDFQEGGKGFGFAVRGLRAENYRVEPLNLKQRGRVPEDAAVLVVAGPQRDLLGEEREALLDWLVKGGRALFLLDPDAPQTFRDLLARWGVVVGEETLVDPGSSVTGDPRTVLLQRDQYAPHPITEPLDVVFFPQAAWVDVREEYKKDPRKKPPWVDYSLLGATSLLSWATSDRDRNSFDPQEDRQGPLPVGLVVQASSTIDREPPNPSSGAPRTTLVVIGDSDFATNKFFYAYTNGDLLLNAVNFLAQDYALISIRPKPSAFRELVVTRREFDFIRYSSWFLLPAGVAVLGLVAWWRRR